MTGARLRLVEPLEADELTPWPGPVLDRLLTALSILAGALAGLELLRRKL